MPHKRAPKWAVEMFESVPGLTHHEALDFVGRAMFSSRWRGVTKYYGTYDRTIERGRSNVEEARNRAEEQFLPCRKAIEKLCDIFFGDTPDNRNAVPAIFLPDNYRIRHLKIAASRWHADDVMKLFPTERLYYDEESDKIVPRSTQDSMRPRELIEGRIVVSQQTFMSRLLAEFPDFAHAAAASKGRPARQQGAAARALKALYGEPNKWPKIADKQLFAQVIDWLTAQGGGPISIWTLRRAIKAARPQSKGRSRSK
jgi:hypothetical protein